MKDFQCAHCSGTVMKNSCSSGKTNHGVFQQDVRRPGNASDARLTLLTLSQRNLTFHGIMSSSGMPTDGATDIFHPRRLLREGQLVALSKLWVQADTLEDCLSFKEPWLALCAKWPDLLRTELEFSVPAFSNSVINLLRHHVNEWHSFSSATPSTFLALAA
jgi:hypothetical protein